MLASNPYQQHHCLLGAYVERSRAEADPAMGGPGGRPPPIDQNLGLVVAARLRYGGKFSLKSLTFGYFFCIKCTRSFQLRGEAP